MEVFSLHPPNSKYLGMRIPLPAVFLRNIFMNADSHGAGPFPNYFVYQFTVKADIRAEVWLVSLLPLPCSISSTGAGSALFPSLQNFVFSTPVFEQGA